MITGKAWGPGNRCIRNGSNQMSPYWDRALSGRTGIWVLLISRHVRCLHFKVNIIKPHLYKKGMFYDTGFVK